LVPSACSKLTFTPLGSSTIFATLVSSITVSQIWPMRSARILTRSRSAAISRPGSISTTDTLVPSAA
jgi:hypothetical protein